MTSRDQHFLNWQNMQILMVEETREHKEPLLNTVMHRDLLHVHLLTYLPREQTSTSQS